MKQIIKLILLAALLLTSCAPQGASEPGKTPEGDYGQNGATADGSEQMGDTEPSEEATQAPEKTFKTKELIPDRCFLDGMTVLSQKDHANGDRIVELGEFRYGESSQAPKWSLAQWDSGPCIWENRVESESNTLTDGVSKWVTYDPEKNSLLLRLNTEAYYQGRGAVQGDYWPHLLVEQDFPYSEASDSEKLFYSGSADKWMLSFDLRMPYYSATEREGDWVRAAQLYMYFGARHKETGRFVWFGLQMLDSRWKGSTDNYFVDGGKADASGQMIYVIGMNNVYENTEGSFWKEDGSSPEVTDEWLHFEIDLIPRLKAMVARGIREGDFDAGTTADDFYIDYMNYGWEIIATYDCGVEIKDLSLISYIEE